MSVEINYLRVKSNVATMRLVPDALRLLAHAAVANGDSEFPSARRRKWWFRSQREASIILRQPVKK